MDIELSVSTVSVSQGRNSLTVSLEDVDTKDIFSNLSIKDIIRHYGESELLSEMDRETIKNELNLTETKEDE